MSTEIDGEIYSYPIESFNIDESYSHIIFNNFNTLELKEDYYHPYDIRGFL